VFVELRGGVEILSVSEWGLLSLSSWPRCGIRTVLK